MEPRKSSLIDTFKSLPRAGQIIVGLVLVAGLIFVGSAAISGISAGLSQSFVSPTPTPATSSPTEQVSAPTDTPVPISTPTPVPQVQYPPKTLADLHGLAARGDMNALHPFHSESVGLTAVCPEPKLEVTVDPKITGQELAEDLLAVFYGQHLDNPCGAALFAFHVQSEADAGTGYTAGRVLLQVADSSGQSNTDPNGTGLKYTLTLDTGDISTGQESTVTYSA